MLLDLRSLVERVIEQVETFIDTRWPRRRRRDPIRASEVVVNARVHLMGVAGVAQIGTVYAAGHARVALKGVEARTDIGSIRARGNLATILEDDEEILEILLLSGDL